MKLLNFGIIGMGNRGEGMLKLLVRSGLGRPGAICDATPGRLDAFESYRERGVSFYTDYRALLDDKSIDAVFITTPDGTHGEILAAALRAGKHAICEKPLEITAGKIDRILEEGRRSDRVIALGYVLRYAPLFAKAKALVAGGAIGRVISVNAVDNINYGGYAFFHDWHRRRENVTSLLLQKASHSLDVVNWLVGARPVQVAAFGGLDVYGSEGARRYLGGEAPAGLRCSACEQERTCPDSILNMERLRGVKWQENWPDACVYGGEVNVDDNQALIVRYENNAKLSYTLNQFTPEYKREYSLIGDRGQLRFDDVSNCIRVTERADKSVATYEVVTAEGHGGGDEGLLSDFLRCCAQGGTPVANLESGAVSARLALSAQRSIDEQRMVSIEYKN